MVSDRTDDPKGNLGSEGTHGRKKVSKAVTQLFAYSIRDTVL